MALGMVLEYATTGGNRLHEFSVIIVTSSMYAITALFCQYYWDEVRHKHTHTHTIRLCTHTQTHIHLSCHA